MKKLCSLFLILLLTLSLVACGEPESTDTLSTGEPALSETLSDTATTDANSDADTETVITDTSGNSDNSTTDTGTDSNGGNPSTDKEYVRGTTTQGGIIDPTVNYTEFQGENVTLPEPPGGYDKLTVLTHSVVHPAGYSRIRKKELADGWTQNLIETLLNAPETGASVEKLSDDETIPNSLIDSYGTHLPVQQYTRWFILEDTMFRYIESPDSKLYRVENHLGAGKEVALSDELKEMLADAIWYAPTNYYTGTWSKDKFELKHTFSAEHDVDVSVNKITHTSDSTDGGKYTVRLTLQSQKDLSVNISYTAHFSEDNLGESDSTTVSLEAGKAKTIDIEFSQYKRHSFTLKMRISADNVPDNKIEIRVQSPMES